jgi:integrase
MSRPRKAVPSYRLHKQSGQAVVTLTDPLGGRRDVLLGVYNSSESRAEYVRVLGEWEANGRCLPRQEKPTDLTVDELLAQYWTWAEGHYRNEDGQPSRELDNLKDALKPLRRLYGHTIAHEFGPLALRAIQAHLVQAGLSRRVVNDRFHRIKRVFKWAVSFELLPGTTYEALRSVPGLARGRSNAKETNPIQPVSIEHVEAALPYMPTPVRAMVQVQLATGCRPGEAQRMRAMDLTMTGPVWTYRPGSHKNKHRGKERVIYLGPQAQEAIRPFLTTNLEGYLFSPRRYVEELRSRRAAERKSKPTPSQLKRKRKARPRRQPRERYDRNSYANAVARACRKAGIHEWTPLQLRHTAGTVIRAKYGLEAAKAILGHSRVETSQIYAERDLAKAQQVMEEIG